MENGTAAMFCMGGLHDGEILGGKVYDAASESYNYGLTLASPLL